VTLAGGRRLTRRGLTRRGLTRLPPWALAAGLAAAYLLLDPRSADLAAQEYRSGLFARVGFTLWDNGWYAGHHVPAYSLLFPPLGAWLGPQVVGALAAVAGTWAFGRLAGREARLAGAWCALAMTTLLITGRLTFGLGVALGLAALAAARGAASGRTPSDVGEVDASRRSARGGRWAGALALAALTSAASPVAGAFVALTVAAWWIGEPGARRAPTLAFAVASVAPAGLGSLLFPEGGTFPFALSSFLPALAGTLLVLAVVPREQRVLRAGVALSAVLLAVSWALPTPMGGNAVRLGALFAGPALAVVLLPAGRARTLAVVAPALLYWQLAAPVDDWRRTAHDASVQKRAYAGLERFLRAEQSSPRAPPFRVEVPFTDNHWEAQNLAGGADGFPLARGWERQLDRRVNALFYDGEPLTRGRYRVWLDANAVRFVALPDAPIDYSAAAEAQLLRDGLPYLSQVYADRVWTVWEVRDATPIGVSALTVDGFTTTRAGKVRIRWSPWFEVVGGRGCIRRTADDRVAADGALTVRARLSVGGALRHDEHCR